MILSGLENKKGLKYAICIKNLTKEFNGLKAVDNISFKVFEGEIFGLLGPNGAGKTTLIKMLATLFKPTSGQAKVNNFNIQKEQDKIRKSIGIVFQEPSLDGRLTGRENLDFHARLYGLNKETRKKRIKEVLNLVGLEGKANILVENYSGGMGRRLEIARGLMHYPKVLFLDEPTLGLDPQTRQYVWKYIIKLNQKENITIILTTHYMEEADYLCHKIGIIDSGRIVVLDTSDNLKNILGGDVISLEAVPQEKAFRFFKEIPWVKKIRRHDQFININVEKGEDKIPLLIKENLKEKEIEIKTINLRKPTLEDVFLHYTGRSIRESESSRTKKNIMRMKFRMGKG